MTEEEIERIRLALAEATGVSPGNARHVELPGGETAIVFEEALGLTEQQFLAFLELMGMRGKELEAVKANHEKIRRLAEAGRSAVCIRCGTRHVRGIVMQMTPAGPVCTACCED